jgi:hypothetical protein
MSRIHSRLAIALLGLIAISCASSSELTRRSEEALARHDDSRAYEDAHHALQKSHGNGRARAALSAAATHLLDARKQRILYLYMAASDTLGAADACLEFEDFRLQAARDGALLVADTSFAARARGIRRDAAEALYRDALDRLKQREPKQAYREMVSARRYAPGYRDLDARIPKAWELAVTRIAVLPFDDDTRVPDLARTVADRTHNELASRVKTKPFEFTELVPSSRVYDALRVSQLGHLTRDGAIDVGRQVGARQVVYGRIHGLNTNSDTDRYHGTIWRRFAERDTAGKPAERWVDLPFDAVQRWRQVRLAVEFEVIDVRTEASLATRERDVDATARTVYTSYVPEGDCGAYRLVPPSMKSNDPDRSERAEKEWAGTFRRWTVPKLLERARRDHSRTHYKGDYRRDFAGLDPDYPVFLDDLPPPDELVRIALDDQWQDVLGVLKELDPKD